MQGLYLNFGLFYETYINLCKDGDLYYYGNLTDLKIDMTSRWDAAEYIAELVADPNRTGEFNFAGD